MVFNPYELHGNQFLLFYSLALVVIFVSTWPWIPQSSGKPHVSPGRLRLEHWAILAGGLGRAAQASFTRSLRDGEIVWNEAELRYEASDPKSEDPIAQMLQNKAQMSDVMRWLEKSYAAQEKELQEWGLLQTLSELSLRQFKIVMAYSFIVLLGIVRMFQGMAHHKPVGLLIILMIVAGWLGIAAVRRCRRPTREGRDLLQNYSMQNAHIRRAPPESEMPLAVAFDGVLMLNGSAYGHFIWSLDPAQKRLESSGDGSYFALDVGGSGDSGDGGDSGCGGCGGGD